MSIRDDLTKIWLMQLNKHELARSKVSINWKEVLNSQCLGFLLFGNQEISLKIVYLWLCFVRLWATAYHKGTKMLIFKSIKILEKKKTVQISLCAIIQHNWNKKTNFPPKRNFQIYGIWILGEIPTLLDSDQNLSSEIILLLSQKQRAFYFRFPAWKSLKKLKIEGKTATKKNLKKKKTVTVYFSDYKY